MLWLTFTFVACGARPSNSTGPTSYPIKDLKALEVQHAYAELVARMGDVAPSERNDEWRAVTERGAGAYLETFELKSADDGQAFLTTEHDLMTRYPHLRTSRIFLAKRAEAAINAFKLTYNSSTHSRSGDSWIDQIIAFAKTDAITPNVAERLAKEVVLGRLIPVTAFPLVKLASERSGSGVCTDKALHPVLVATLDDGSWPAEVKTVMAICWSNVKPEVMAKFAAPDNEDFVKHTCAVLADLPKAAADLKAKCSKP